jgi:hypothetical protein
MFRLLITGLLSTVMAIGFMTSLSAQSGDFNGLDLGLHNIYRLSDAESRSISPENFTGEKGKAGMATEGTNQAAARELGQGWKVSPSMDVEPGQELVLADITGPGQVQSIWMTISGVWRWSILRFYWDGETEPSVEVPAGDFFAAGWGNRDNFVQVTSQPICVNPGSAFNSYWPMPFRKNCKITVENLNTIKMRIYYQINYTLTDVPKDAAYFHGQFRRSNPLPYKEVYTLLDGVKGQGHYVGTVMSWGVNNNGWWGEGEIKFFMDGDNEFPTICGTGTEDYFGGSYNFKNRVTGEYTEFSTPYLGMPQVIRPTGSEMSMVQRFGLYRWHILDPIRFKKDLKVTIQALGWRADRRYLPLQDDISSAVFWYQNEPHAKFPPLPDKDYLENR